MRRTISSLAGLAEANNLCVWLGGTSDDFFLSSQSLVLPGSVLFCVKAILPEPELDSVSQGKGGEGEHSFFLF